MHSFAYPDELKYFLSALKFQKRVNNIIFNWVLSHLCPLRASLNVQIKYSAHWILQPWIKRPDCLNCRHQYVNGDHGYNDLKFHLL